ncbi:hypothetical protein [Flammeovirga agarivorans]|uniref:Uncharacterized protein n=1 Tax=Flammeovirga agarivorans TaxID=2726742 RepID=A0A7X8SK73_9BACT|nr:hypothetical protein [Flammeovirga agarivorans]NLR91770.1 hypothetical protein [Flammeovirga agarivorans]
MLLQNYTDKELLEIGKVIFIELPFDKDILDKLSFLGYPAAKLNQGKLLQKRVAELDEEISYLMSTNEAVSIEGNVLVKTDHNVQIDGLIDTKTAYIQKLRSWIELFFVALSFCQVENSLLIKKLSKF